MLEIIFNFVLALSAGACSSSFYQLDGKCINFFPNAGLRDHDKAGKFCKLNGGELARDIWSDNNYQKGNKLLCFVIGIQTL